MGISAALFCREVYVGCSAQGNKKARPRGLRAGGPAGGSGIMRTADVRLSGEPFMVAARALARGCHFTLDV